MMRRVRTVGLGVGLALLAGTGEPSRALAQQGGGVNYVELFSQLDANNDKVIEKGEVPESGKAAFEQLLKHADKNKDGKIDRDEYRDMLLALREANPGPGAGAGGGQGAFAQMDKNGDGKVTRDEFTGPRPLFDRIDADKDGVISRDEGDKFRAASGGPLGAGMVQVRFAAMDKDADGKISRDEFTGQKPVFDRLDADNDGFLNQAEATPFLNGSAMLQRLKAMDKDGDGKVSRDEFTGQGPAFNRLDANQDGFVTQEEATRVLSGGAGAGAGQGFMAPRFREMDANNDQKISKAEFTGPEPQFNRIDADKDGFLTPAEVRRFFAPGAPAKKKDAQEKPKPETEPAGK